MKLKFNLKRETKIAAAILVVVGIIAFTERRQGSLAVRDITVKLENVNENHFLDERDIIGLMELDKENMRGASLDKVNLKELERKIKREPFVKSVQLYSDIKGNVVVRAEVRRPIARIIRSDGPDGYIAEDGTIMPVSHKFTTRTLLVSGSYMRKLLQLDKLTDTDEGKNLMELIQVIQEDEFWRAQIAQVDVDSKQRITLFPQVGDERIEFGKPVDIEGKLRKLMIFYHEVVPRKGWNTYKRINLEYAGQIVTE